MRSFDGFVCIDWSGQAVARPKGLAMAFCKPGTEPPALIAPEGGWSRAAILEWLMDSAKQGSNILIGLDLSPALPFVDAGGYFPGFPAPEHARALWALVDEVCSGEPHLGVTSFVDHANYSRYFRRHGGREGAAFGGGAGRMRVVEHRQRGSGVSPVSCFNLVGAAQVGKSSLTGMRVLNRLSGTVPVWPFDIVPATGPVIVEIYTSIAARAAGLRKGLSKIRDAAGLDAALGAFGSQPHTPLPRYTDHATDAIVTSAWLRHVHSDAELWQPSGMTPEIAHTEGWTFGVR